MSHTYARALPRPTFASVLISRLPVPALRAMIETAQQRRQLAELGPERLEDLGLSLEDARLEAQRPFWDAPHAWRH